MKVIKMASINVFLAEFKIQKKALAKLLNVDPSNISYYVSNDYQVIYDNSGYCEIVKTQRKFDLNHLITEQRQL